MGDSSRKELIDKLDQLVSKNLPPEEVAIIKTFISQYYLSVSLEDLQEKSVDDIYCAILAYWRFIFTRSKNEVKVRAYNPTLEEHGWQSSHTIVEMTCDHMPFLIDSVRMALTKIDINIHILISLGGMRFCRDDKNEITKIKVKSDKECENCYIESPIYIEIDKQSDNEILREIEESIKKVLECITTSVNDWHNMKSKAKNTADSLDKLATLCSEESIKESKEFLNWIMKDHFTFLGCCEYKLVNKEKDEYELQAINGSQLGLFKKDIINDLLPVEATLLKENDSPVVLGKKDIVSPVHRAAFLDFISIKKVDSEGNLIGELRFIGLYTAIAYSSRPKWIPIIRKKVENILGKSNFSEKTHDYKVLLNILETIPRDELFHTTEDELEELATGILHLQERQRIRLFIRRDRHKRFFSCLVFVPKEHFDSALRIKFQNILLEKLDGIEANFTTFFSESVLARIHFLIRLAPDNKVVYKIKNIENKLIEASKTWSDSLLSVLLEQQGEEKSNGIFKRYKNAFPESYKENFAAKIAVVDIKNIEEVIKEKKLNMGLYRLIEEKDDSFRFKLYRLEKPIPLSDIVPLLENMGLRIISERPYFIKVEENIIWINDYKMVHVSSETADIETVRDIFQEAFQAIWSGKAENDRFNRLVLNVKLTWRQITILRAYGKYLWQIGVPFSLQYIADVLNNNPVLTEKLIHFFDVKFNPKINSNDELIATHKNAIETDLESVASLYEDRIIRKFLYVMQATLRTNFYQTNKDGCYKDYLSLKLFPEKIPEIPLPVPMFEIFVYSPIVEGVHLRGGKIARGGLRWSDRKEDFRTEVLGLVKAQQVKNSVIVPKGAKGGFIIKNNTENLSRELLMQEVIKCYQIFIRGLLDITDNIIRKEIVHPENVIKYDQDDPYLVVAADKGTATFSDIANQISLDYKFWLGDAFASGGSVGYDHKKMGITARGAWESVKRHFKEIGLDTQNESFTVVGIGDMAGDVFGNGMLLSPYIKLVAAYNHMHIFIDPNPDCVNSFEERKRLFALPRSSWTDYNSELISQGGGIFWRSAKSIPISHEMKILFCIEEDALPPNELIRKLLQSPVDLLWNGGIGTFVKSTKETDEQVGDRSNDAIRIFADKLSAKVIGEGGNLGLTQLARIEYSKNGGSINTDAIDNSAGVDCSDNEVNIKILLNGIVNYGDMTTKQRNSLLADMTDEVADLVLRNNKKQTEAISIALSQAGEDLEMHIRVLEELELSANLNRELEFLPDNDEIANRLMNKRGLTRPELSVLMAYAKNLLKDQLIDSDVPEDKYILKFLHEYFPKPLQESYLEAMESHPLKREIIATEVSNTLINEMGISFIHRLHDETGASSADVVKSYMVAREVFGYYDLKNSIQGLNMLVSENTKINILQEFSRLLRRTTRWFLRNRRSELNISELIADFAKPVRRIKNNLSSLLCNSKQEWMNQDAEQLIEDKIPREIAYNVAGVTAMYSALDIVEAAITYDFDVLDVADLYFSLGDRLDLRWFRNQIKKHPITNHWEALARAAFRDDVDRQQCNLTIGALQFGKEKQLKGDIRINEWMKYNEILLKRWEYFVIEMKTMKNPEFTVFAVALRELLDLFQASSFNRK